jgi:TM2 domain-containing membrane protein YozV
MKKFFLIALIVFAGLFATQAHAESFTIDNQVIDQMFAQADIVSFDAELAMNHEGQYFIQDKDPVVAFLLATFLGGLGIHRAYLGTSTGTMIAYILTMGGCGIVTTIDWVMLIVGLVNNDISQYVDNPRFFMW